MSAKDREAFDVVQTLAVRMLEAVSTGSWRDDPVKTEAGKVAQLLRQARQGRILYLGGASKWPALAPLMHGLKAYNLVHGYVHSSASK